MNDLQVCRWVGSFRVAGLVAFLIAFSRYFAGFRFYRSAGRRRTVQRICDYDQHLHPHPRHVRRLDHHGRPIGLPGWLPPPDISTQIVSFYYLLNRQLML
jgi:hypothetical protein